MLQVLAKKLRPVVESLLRQLPPAAGRIAVVALALDVAKVIATLASNSQLNGRASSKSKVKDEEELYVATCELLFMFDEAFESVAPEASAQSLQRRERRRRQVETVSKCYNALLSDDDDDDCSDGDDNAEEASKEKRKSKSKSKSHGRARDDGCDCSGFTNAHVSTPLAGSSSGAADSVSTSLLVSKYRFAAAARELLTWSASQRVVADGGVNTPQSSSSATESLLSVLMISLSTIPLTSPSPVRGPIPRASKSKNATNRNSSGSGSGNTGEEEEEEEEGHSDSDLSEVEASPYEFILPRISWARRAMTVVAVAIREAAKLNALTVSKENMPDAP